MPELQVLCNTEVGPLIGRDVHSLNSHILLECMVICIVCEGPTDDLLPSRTLCKAIAQSQ